MLKTLCRKMLPAMIHDLCSCDTSSAGVSQFLSLRVMTCTWCTSHGEGGVVAKFCIDLLSYIDIY